MLRNVHYAVATQHPLATRAAIDVLDAGGSAADAAIAAALALGVVTPDCSGLGGGGFAIVWDAARRRATAFDFRETAPTELRPELLERDRVRPASGTRGMRVGVPGELAGLLEIHRRYGRRAFAEDVEPAIEIADGGFLVSAALARNAYALRGPLLQSPQLGELFTPRNVGPVFDGYLLHRARLARTLRGIARDGLSGFYQGPVAADLVHAARTAGGWLSVDDLRKYRVRVREPIELAWNGYDVLTMPPPSAGGLLLAETLKLTSVAELRGLQLNSGGYIHALAEVFRDALADRIQSLADPEFVRTALPDLLADVRLEHRRADILPNRTHALPASLVQEHGTSHVVVVDGEGNVVSLTTTIGDAFGSLLAGEESGVILNDELVDFTTRRQYKPFTRDCPSCEPPNAPRPGARPVSSMTPTIVVRDGRPVLAVGGAGGLHIATGVTQALLSALVFGETPEHAVQAPRFHTPYDGPTVEIEYGTPDDVARDLRGRGERVALTANFSAVQMVSITYAEDGTLEFLAAADPRFGGAAATK